ncbi:hypothetical protein TSUD_80270 [Trifolium subterraneum]|uniref:Uncharacterized protein n=1 Tax=Trifolium subterraneum TaxID=3900 RepID=A0A2Z6LLH0_TRISU|nr:hypothetical protein TSUD_80270 [Trifolium subterraneum]
MEEGGNRSEIILSCAICGTLFSVLGFSSFSILWAVNWRPWRIYRCTVVIASVKNRGITDGIDATSPRPLTV